MAIAIEQPTLGSETQTRCNFLAMVQLVAKYDPVMASHMFTMQQQSAKRQTKLKGLLKREWQKACWSCDISKQIHRQDDNQHRQQKA